jgi:hypothetical protein
VARAHKKLSAPGNTLPIHVRWNIRITAPCYHTLFTYIYYKEKRGHQAANVSRHIPQHMFRLFSKQFFFALIAFGLSSCDRFESRFYERIDECQINAIAHSTDTLILSELTDFDWDSVLFVPGNESVPVLAKEIEPILGRQTADLPTFTDRFYFLTADKSIIIMEISSTIHNHNPAVEFEHCNEDKHHYRKWLSRQESMFIAKTNVLIPGSGTLFLYPICLTRSIADSLPSLK